MGLFIAIVCQKGLTEDRRTQKRLINRVKILVNVSLTCQSVQRVSVMSRGQADKHHLLPEMTDPREGQHKVPPTQQLNQWRLNLSQHGRRPETNKCVNILGTYTKSQANPHPRVLSYYVIVIINNLLMKGPKKKCSLSSGGYCAA